MSPSNKTPRKPGELGRSAQANKPPVGLIAGGVIALVIAIAVAIALAISGGKDEADDSLVFGTPTVTGAPLPQYAPGGTDPAVGMTGPKVAGQDLTGRPVSVAMTGRPTVLAFLAHWCPHCRSEVPVLVDLADDPALEGVELIGVATGTKEGQPNFPPGPWLNGEGWKTGLVVDSEQYEVANAYGLAGFPYFVVLDAEGKVVARTSGELAADQVRTLAKMAKAGAAGN